MRLPYLENGRMKKKQLKSNVLKILKIISVSMGCLFLILLLLALTPVPFYMHYSLGTDPNESEQAFSPDYIIMLGGAGMPSKDNLMRLFYTAEFANKFHADVIVLHPEDSLCHTLMQRELISKGVDSNKITFIDRGTNTYLQLLHLKEQRPELINRSLLVVTSPEHLTRAIKCFNKTGFASVRGKATFEAVIDFDLSFKKEKLGGNKYVPSVESTSLRYTFWNYLKLEIDCFREYAALFYYKLKNWI